MNKNDILEIVKEMIKSIVNENIEISFNLKLIDIGINSIQFIKLIIKLEEYFNIEFDEEHLSASSFENISYIVEYIYIKIEK